jgi:hypothetical protein
MTLTTIAKASAIYMLAAILYSGGHFAWQTLAKAPQGEIMQKPASRGRLRCFEGSQARAPMLLCLRLMNSLAVSTATAASRQ